MKMLFLKSWVLSQDAKYETYRVMLMFVLFGKFFRIGFPIWIRKSGLSDKVIAEINAVLERLEGKNEKK